MHRQLVTTAALTNNKNNLGKINVKDFTTIRNSKFIEFIWKYILYIFKSSSLFQLHGLFVSEYGTLDRFCNIYLIMYVMMSICAEASKEL